MQELSGSFAFFVRQEPSLSIASINLYHNLCLFNLSLSLSHTHTHTHTRIHTPLSLSLSHTHTHTHTRIHTPLSPSHSLTQSLYLSIYLLFTLAKYFDLCVYITTYPLCFGKYFLTPADTILKKNTVGNAFIPKYWHNRLRYLSANIYIYIYIYILYIYIYIYI